MNVLVTGATGFVGSHVAERLASEGHGAIGLVRDRAKAAWLADLGVELREGDLTEPESLAGLGEGIDAVVHCAAMVGEWGTMEEYRRVNVEGLRLVIEACQGDSLSRFVLVSSLGVYAARDHQGTDETEPLPERHVDAYTHTKVEAERLAAEYAERGLPLVVLRPGFVYGPRDRIVMPRILKNLRKGRVTYFGSSSKLMNNVYVGHVVDAALLALTKEGVVGGTYNLRDGRLVSKKEFFETIADGAGLPRPAKTMPMWVGKALCPTLAVAGKAFGFSPPLNRARLKFMGLNLDYSIDRARRELGYDPRVDFAEGMAATLDWLRADGVIPAKQEIPTSG